MSHTNVVLESLQFHPIGEHAEPEEQPLHDFVAPRLADTFAVGAGGMGKEIILGLRAEAALDGLDLACLVPDSDWRLPDPILLPNGRLIGLPASALIRLGSDHPRNRIKDEPLLNDRYVRGGLLRGIPVFETHPVAGFGGGGYPVISAIDLDLAIRDLRRGLRTWFLTLVQRPELPVGLDPWQVAVRGEREAGDQQMPRRPVVIIVGGGCGSVGPASHLLLPYLVRDVARRLGLPDPYIVGVVAGPRLFAGFHPRAATNWLATVQQLDDLNRDGLHWSFIDGTTIDDATPPYDRIVLVDAEPEAETATEAELARFALDVARSLYVAIASDVLTRGEALAIDHRAYPWSTLSGVYAHVDWDIIEPLATAIRASERLGAL